VLNEFIATGIYRPRTSAQTRQTSSPSMDISKASNLERFVFDLVDRDPERLRALWADVERTGAFDLSDRRDAIHDRFGFVSGTSSHADRVATIRDTATRAKRQIDPHTADGVFVGRQFQEPGVRLVCLETALPAKFAETIEEALGVAPDRPAAFADIESRPQRFDVVDADVDVVKQIIVRNGRSAT
jgi:threonine synthase